MAASSASIWRRCRRSRKRWRAVTRPCRAARSLLRRRLDAAVDQGEQLVGIGLAVDQRLEHRAAAHAHDVGQHRGELEVGVLQRLLDPLDVAGLLAHQLLAGAQQRAHLLGRRLRHEAGADQTVRQQIGQPGASATSVLRPGTFLTCAALARISVNSPSTGCARPASSRRRSPPSRRGCSRSRPARRTAPAGPASWCRRCGPRSVAAPSPATRDTRDNRVLVHVEAGAARIENVHGSLRLLRRRRRAPLDQSLNNALPGLAAHGAIGGASGAPGPTNTRARSHHENSRPLRRRSADNATGFIAGGSAFRWRTNPHYAARVGGSSLSD